jgi:hypothetical protein
MGRAGNSFRRCDSFSAGRRNFCFPHQPIWHIADELSGPVALMRGSYLHSLVKIIFFAADVIGTAASHLDKGCACRWEETSPPTAQRKTHANTRLAQTKPLGRRCRRDRNGHRRLLPTRMDNERDRRATCAGAIRHVCRRGARPILRSQGPGRSQPCHACQVRHGAILILAQ